MQSENELLFVINFKNIKWDMMNTNYLMCFIRGSFKMRYKKKNMKG